MARRAPQDGSKRAQDGPQMDTQKTPGFQDGPEMASRWPKINPGGLKMAKDGHMTALIHEFCNKLMSVKGRYLHRRRARNPDTSLSVCYLAPFNNESTRSVLQVIEPRQ